MKGLKILAFILRFFTRILCFIALVPVMFFHYIFCNCSALLLIVVHIITSIFSIILIYSICIKDHTMLIGSICGFFLCAIVNLLFHFGMDVLANIEDLLIYFATSTKK